MERCPPGKYDFTASSKSDCPQPRRNTRLRASHSLSERQKESVYRHIVTLSRGATGHKGLFFEADPLSRLFPRFSFSLFQVLVDVVPPPPPPPLPPLPPPPEAKTSFESPVSALHAEAFVAARILLNMRRLPKQLGENRGGGEFSQIVV